MNKKQDVLIKQRAKKLLLNAPANKIRKKLKNKAVKNYY